MVELEVRFVAQSHHLERAGDGSFSGGQEGPQEKDLSTPPNSIEKQGSEC
jgi:hypothetical protein